VKFTIAHSRLHTLHYSEITLQWVRSECGEVSATGIRMHETSGAVARVQ
jgi:hypothetical protein